MSRTGSFRLQKWYLDVVTDDGEAFIGYATKLRYGLLRLSSGALLHAVPGESPRTASQLSGVELPELRDGALHWSSPPCEGRGDARSDRRAHGTWTAQVAGPELTLLQRDDGELRWHAVQARSSVRLALPDGRTLTGLGYAERLELSIAPWRLPIRELRWGRFVSAGAALAWIDWRGSHPLSLVLLDGAVVAGAAAPRGAPVPPSGAAAPMPSATAPPSGAAISEEAIALADGSRLDIEAGATLRDGTLGSSALQSVPLLRAVLPAALLGTRETKWLGRGTFTRRDGRVERGAVIHELVRFPEAVDPPGTVRAGSP